MSTLVSFIERAADLLSGVDGLHWKQLLASSWMATDGTGLKVIYPKLPAAHNGYLELYRNDELAVFQYEPDKRGDVVAAKLRPFRGTLTADAEHRFNDVFASYPFGLTRHGQTTFVAVEMLGDGELRQTAKARHVERRWRAASAEFRPAREYASN